MMPAAKDVHLNGLMERVKVGFAALSDAAYRRAISELIAQVIGFYEASMSADGRTLAQRAPRGWRRIFQIATLVR